MSGVSSRMKGTKKFPHCITNVKMNTTTMPGAISGSTTRHSDWSQFAPSVHAASSSETGTASMKFFVIQIANGSELAVMNRTVAGSESTRLTRA